MNKRPKSSQSPNPFSNKPLSPSPFKRMDIVTVSDLKEYERQLAYTEQWWKRLEKRRKQFERNLRKMAKHILEKVSPALRRKISEGTRKGLARAKRRGVKLGRPKVPGASTRRMREMEKRGLTQQEIAQKLGVTQSLVSKRLKKEE